MRRLDAFPGFVLPSRGGSLGIKKVVREVANILEAADTDPIVVESPTIAPVPAPTGAPVSVPAALPSPPPPPVNPFTTIITKPKASPLTLVAPTPAPVAMIQPRASDGQRLLYKHPNLPCVGPAGAYWLLVGNSDRSSGASLLQFDGGANPNPGPASAGAVLWSPLDITGKRQVEFESGRYLGKATNNIAEVQGLLLGLKIAATRGARELLIEGDSELIIFQQTGKYKVKDKNLKVWWSEIQAALMDETAFDWVAIRQVPREQNERADSVTKEVLDKKASFSR
jgi:ribonuclease HI